MKNKCLCSCVLEYFCIFKSGKKNVSDRCIPLLLLTLGLLLTASRGRAFASSLGGQLFTWSLTPTEFSIRLLDTSHGFQTSRVGEAKKVAVMYVYCVLQPNQLNNNGCNFFGFDDLHKSLNRLKKTILFIALCSSFDVRNPHD